MSTTVDPQTSIEERELDSTQLLTALETRQTHKDNIKQVRKALKDADSHAKALLEEFNLQDGEIARIGRFRISKKRVPSRSVAFETDPTSRLTISLLPEA